ncbi:MerR family transcriptional regulator [Streptomyces sp. NBC_00237]|uniref:MerR family transcriptional regulator n=1 Tax=Streptomyces sp. NBC_00237 TaxID=2975687 RepID=UPI002254CB20|nr:MerR family transcriptional regulator [Streptomyces sp. NBC_00237]MCX5207162.1 MerR family transcriptional regulator [Streptomyces sp. NBC_00237]
MNGSRIPNDGTTTHHHAAGMTTGDVARRLGVAPTTLRSWDRRYGIGPAVRDDGRHRRWAAADIDLLERMCALTARGVPPAEAARLARENTPAPENAPARKSPPPASAPPAPLAKIPTPRLPSTTIPVRTVRGLRNAAVRLDSPLIDRMLTSTVHSHGLAGTWEGAMSPALRAIGRTWASSGDPTGERYVEAEHLLSWHISTALRRNADTEEPGDDEQPVLLACLPGEMHTLALEALTATLVERGLPVRMFGAAVPLRALAEAVRRTGPRAVVLWSQTRPTADRAVLGMVRSTARGIRGARTQPMVLAGGPGWSRTAPTEGVHRPHSLADALELVESTAYC